ncbi:MAG: NAD-dependent epimerase/dehydratase family protein [Gammaproteobacteria bacterium]|nr:NAD-dependent epimerase/dehydratase family protein [Gammaproteobacteria bacterium]
MSATPKGAVLVTGCSGFIGGSVIERLAADYRIIGLDWKAPDDESMDFIEIDLSSDISVKKALNEVKKRGITRISSVVHLAAYFDLTGEPNEKYDEITVRGTERLLTGLQEFDTEQFIFASSMLAHAPCKPGETINEEWPLEPRMPYDRSKVKTEHKLREMHGDIPIVLLRPAGVYDELCRNAFLAHQIARIWEKRLIAHFYPGNLATGQSFLHLDDLTDAIAGLIKQRKHLPVEISLLLGEGDAIGIEIMQSELGKLLHGEEWQTWEIPKAVARTGAWMQNEVVGLNRFIKPWMVDIADDHYALDTSRARELIGWKPKHSLKEELPRMADVLKADPATWYEVNRLTAEVMEAQSAEEPPPPTKSEKKEHHEEMRDEHYSTLWAHFSNIMLGIWLATSPFVWDGFSQTEFREAIWRVTEDRNLLEPSLRSEMLAWSDLVSGLLIVVFATLSLFSRFAWAMWANTAVGCWLLFAPLLFWSPSAAVYANDTLVGTLVIAFAILVPMMPGMSHKGMMDESYIPPGWTYSPSTYAQRIPIIGLGLVGFLIARYLTAFQLGHIDAARDPFFGDGTEVIITSDVSKAWPVADAGLGAISYLFEVLMGIMGDRRRWRTMPWMVLGFGVVVVPLGAVSIFFIVIQPIVIGTWCTLCLITAAAMVIMIPFTLDEVVASCQYLAEGFRRKQTFWRNFFQGGQMAGGTMEEEKPQRIQDYFSISDLTHGVTWQLLVCCGIGIALMFTRLIFGTEGAMADSDHLIGSLVIVVAVTAFAEVARPVRFINIFFGLWLIAAPLFLDGESVIAAWASMTAGLSLMALSLPLGKRSDEHYGSWDRYVL